VDTNFIARITHRKQFQNTWKPPKRKSANIIIVPIWSSVAPNRIKNSYTWEQQTRYSMSSGNTSNCTGPLSNVLCIKYCSVDHHKNPTRLYFLSVSKFMRPSSETIIERIKFQANCNWERTNSYEQKQIINECENKTQKSILISAIYLT
jgi:hypothetical protein